MDVNEAAAKYGVSKTTIYRMIERGEIAARKIDGEWHIEEEAAMEDQQQEGAEASEEGQEEETKPEEGPGEDDGPVGIDGMAGEDGRQESFGEYIKRAREAAGLDYGMLGRAAGGFFVDSLGNTLAPEEWAEMLEEGLVKPYRKQALAMALALGIDSEEMMLALEAATD